jgi:hypothetical protein
MSDAADKLARTRLAIIEHVHRKEIRKDRRGAAAHDEEGDPWSAAEEAAASGGGGWFSRVSSAARSYWRHHPARMGLQMATPALSAYARRHPGAYVSVAAIAGAVFMIVRPWRLISITGVLVALAKSPQLASVVMSAVSGGGYDDDDPFR